MGGAAITTEVRIIIIVNIIVTVIIVIITFIIIINNVRAHSLLLTYIPFPFSLINDNVNMASPDDIAYVTAGFAPILVRLVQAIGGSKWTSGSFGESLKLLPGPLLEFNQVAGAPFEELQDVLER